MRNPSGGSGAAANDKKIRRSRKERVLAHATLHPVERPGVFVCDIGRKADNGGVIGVPGAWLSHPGGMKPTSMGRAKRGRQVVGYALIPLLACPCALALSKFGQNPWRPSNSTLTDGLLCRPAFGRCSISRPAIGSTPNSSTARSSSGSRAGRGRLQSPKKRSSSQQLLQLPRSR